MFVHRSANVTLMLVINIQWQCIYYGWYHAEEVGEMKSRASARLLPQESICRKKNLGNRKYNVYFLFNRLITKPSIDTFHKRLSFVIS